MEIKARALAMVAAGEYSCVAWKEELCYRASGMGVKPIITPMRTNKKFFQGLQVADTIIGKAAALLLALSGATYVHGCIMSRAAVAVFQRQGMAYEYDHLVDYIYNRQQNGLCPLEQSVLDVEEPEQAWDRLEAKLQELMASSSSK